MMSFMLKLQFLMWMRGLGVMWSPDSLGNDVMKTRTEPGNPEAKQCIYNYLQIFTNDCLGETLSSGSEAASGTSSLVNLFLAFSSTSSSSTSF